MAFSVAALRPKKSPSPDSPPLPRPLPDAPRQPTRTSRRTSRTPPSSGAPPHPAPGNPGRWSPRGGGGVRVVLPWLILSLNFPSPGARKRRFPRGGGHLAGGGVGRLSGCSHSLFSGPPLPGVVFSQGGKGCAHVVVPPFVLKATREPGDGAGRHGQVFEGVSIVFLAVVPFGLPTAPAFSPPPWECPSSGTRRVSWKPCPRMWVPVRGREISS